MADEEEIDSEEGEEEEEEQAPPPKKNKKRVGARGPRNNKNLREHGTLGGSNLYPRGVPIDDRGIAEEDVELDRGTVRRIGAFDPESARITEQSRRVLQRKARGEAGVKWNAEASVRYWEVKQMHPAARVSVKQVLPVNDESIPAVNFQICKSYDDLKQYVRAKHWRGNHAIYEWKIYDDQHSSLAVGKFEFAENPDFDSQLPQQAPQPQSQPAQQPQWPGYPPPGYGAPPGYPPPGYGPPPYPGYPAQPQQQPPPQPPQPQAGGSELAQVLAQNNYLISVLVAEKSGHAPPLPPEYYTWLANKDKPPPPPVEPAPPVNPLHELDKAVNMVDSVAAVARKLENRFGGGGPQPNEPPPPGEDDNFPIQIRKVGPVNMGSKDGEMLPMGAQLALNAGTLVDLFDGFLKKGKETAREIAESRQRTLQLEAERERERLRNLERAAEINREMQQPRPPAPQNPATAMPWSQPWSPPAPPEPPTVVEGPEDGVEPGEHPS